MCDSGRNVKRSGIQCFCGGCCCSQRLIMNLLEVVSVLTWAFCACAGQCTFPSGVRGAWMTNSNGDITITADTIQDYPVGSYGTFTLDCDQNYGGRYIAKSQTAFTVFRFSMYAYFCFDFRGISSNLYYYYLATNESNGYQTVFRTVTNTPTAAEVCELSRSQYDPGQYQVMVKNGDGYAARTSCPTDLAGGWEYGIDSGSGNTCSITSGELSGCTGSQLTANYTACSTQVFYSSAGVVYCLASVTSGSTTYLTVFNSDSAVDNANTFRMACLVFQKSGDDLYLTQYPEECQSGQTPTSVSTPTGSKLTLTDYSACPTTPETTDITLSVILGLIGGLVGLFVIGLVVFMLFTWKGKQRPFRGKLEPQKPQGLHGAWHTSSGRKQQDHRVMDIENGFKRCSKDDGKTHSRDVTPETDDDDAPINVMQLLRKDVIPPGGRETPASNILLSITTPTPYSGPDGAGTPMPNPADNTLLKKHYHVIGAEPPIGELEEMESVYAEADDNSSTTPQNSGNRLPVSPRTPVMVMPVQAEGSDHFEGGDNDTDDDDDLGGMYDSDGQSTLVAARQGVGIHEPMCPPSRLPPIDEGPATHRSYTGSGNGSNSRRRNNGHSQPHTTTTTITTAFSELSPTTILEEVATPRSDATDTPSHSLDALRRDSPCGSDRDDLHSARSDTPSGRRSSLGLLYKMEGNTMVAIPDTLEKVETGSGTVDKKPGSGKKAATLRGRKPDGVRLKPLVRSAGGGGRRGSLGHMSPRGHSAALLSSTTDPKKKLVTPGRGRKDKGRHGELLFPDEDEFKPTARVKVTRVDIPELLPPGEIEARAPGENELLESPAHSYHNTAYGEDRAGGDGNADLGVTPRKVWLVPPGRRSEDVWGRVSSLWKLGNVWPDPRNT